MRRLTASLAAAILGLLLAGAPAVGQPQAARCTTSDYAMQCHYGQPSSLLGVSPLTSPKVYAYGVDFAWSKPTVAWMRRAGAVFAAGYYSTDASKNLTGGWANAYHAAGIRTLAVWETTANRAAAGCAAGQADAQRAAAQARAAGEPASRPIFFAVDFNTSPNPGVILSYFRCVRSSLGSRTGAYGGIATMRVLFGNGLIRWGWQTSAWSGGVWDPRAQLQQYAYGQTLDWDRAVTADYGQWPAPAPPKPTPEPKRCSSAQVQLSNSLNGSATVTVSKGRWTISNGWKVRSMPFNAAPGGARC